LTPAPGGFNPSGCGGLSSRFCVTVTMPSQILARLEKKNIRLDDEVRFIRSWLEKPLAIGAVTPSTRTFRAR
jgi:hypothetical protein